MADLLNTYREGKTESAQSAQLNQREIVRMNRAIN